MSIVIQASEDMDLEKAAVARRDDREASDQELVDQARAEGLELVGENGLLGRLARLVLESALEGEVPTISAMTSTIRPVAAVGTSATASDPRQC